MQTFTHHFHWAALPMFGVQPNTAYVWSRAKHLPFLPWWPEGTPSSFSLRYFLKCKFTAFSHLSCFSRSWHPAELGPVVGLCTACYCSSLVTPREEILEPGAQHSIAAKDGSSGLLLVCMLIQGEDGLSKTRIRNNCWWALLAISACCFLSDLPVLQTSRDALGHWDSKQESCEGCGQQCGPVLPLLLSLCWQGGIQKGWCFGQ